MSFQFAGAPSIDNLAEQRLHENCRFYRGGRYFLVPNHFIHFFPQSSVSRCVQTAQIKDSTACQPCWGWAVHGGCSPPDMPACGHTGIPSVL